MSIAAEPETPEAEQPTQLAWAETGRMSNESRMDIESSVFLRCYLAGDFSSASDWNDLVARLFAKGFHLVFDQERLTLVNFHNGVGICTCRYLGFGFAELAERLGKPCVLADACRIIASPHSQ